MKLTNYLGDRPFWGVAMKLALPIALQNVLSSSFVIVDTMMVSRLGDVTLSAVGMAGQLGWLFNLVSFGMCSGMSVFVSQYWGIRDKKGIRRVLGIALMTALVLSALFVGVAQGLPEQVLRLFNQDPLVVATGCRYLKIICFSYPAVAMALIMGTVLRGTDRVNLPVYVSGITTLANVFLDYGLIFGRFGMPELGLEGAAIASVISAWLGPVLLFVISLAEKNMLVGPVRELVAFGPRNLWAFYKKAAPVVFNESAWAVCMLILNMIYSNLGYEYYAGMTVFKTFSELAFAFYCGLCNACIIMVGRSVGQGKIERALLDSHRFTVLVSLAGLVVGGLTILLRKPLISMFSMGDNLSQVTLDTANAVLIFCSCEAWFRNIPYVQIVGVFRSGGDTGHGVIFDMASLCIFSIPLTYVAANVLHLPFLTVVMVAYLAEDLPKVFMCLRYFRTLRWLQPVTEEGREGTRIYLENRKKG